MFPEIQPYNTGMLKVCPRHEIYFEECGNPNGYPILFLHGGPGAGCDAKDRRYFDPAKWRIILFDQRGSGRSKPFGETKENSTWALCADIRKLLEHLGITRVVLFGGSWGSTLALVFAVQETQMVSGMVLRGIFLGEEEEIKNLWNGSTGHYFPEAWIRFASMVPPKHRRSPAEYYYEQLMSKDATIRKKFAYEWSRYEMALLHLEPEPDEEIDKEMAEFSFESMAIMEAHYLYKNQAFLENKYIIKNANCLSNIPTTIIQGRYDVVCPPVSAYRLAKVIKGSELHIVIAGHSSSDPEIRKKLVSQTEAMYEKVAK